LRNRKRRKIGLEEILEQNILKVIREEDKGGSRKQMK